MENRNALGVLLKDYIVLSRLENGNLIPILEPLYNDTVFHLNLPICTAFISFLIFLKYF